MVDVIRCAMLALIALAVAVPPAAALPDPDDLIATDGPAPPHLLPGDGPDDLVRIEIKDTDGGAGAGAEAGGNEVQMQAGCTQRAAIQQTSCGGAVCVFRGGHGPLPVYIVDPAEGIGAGVDTGLLGSGGPSEEADASGPSGGYGPYNGVMVSAEGHCDP